MPRNEIDEVKIISNGSSYMLKIITGGTELIYKDSLKLQRIFDWFSDEQIDVIILVLEIEGRKRGKGKIIKNSNCHPRARFKSFQEIINILKEYRKKPRFDSFYSA